MTVPEADLDSRFAAAQRVADAVLYEGYVLYPYRASAQKNQLRWQFGVLAPPACAGSEPAAMRTEVIVEAPADSMVHVRVRALQVQARTVETPSGPAALLDVDGELWTSFDEAVEHEIDVLHLPLAVLAGRSHLVEMHWGGGETTEAITDRRGSVAGRLVRRTWPVDAEVTVSAVPLAAERYRLAVGVANTGAWSPTGSAPTRDDVVRRSLVAVHTLLAIDGGRFVSALDPPAEQQAAVAACRNEGTYPVLIDDRVVLSSPIILYDRPQVAPESLGDMFDATEIDEILALRVLTLTDEEKREARATDPRSAAVVDRCDAMGPDAFAALHGTFRSLPAAETGELPWWEPTVDAGFDPWADTVWIGPAAVGKGTRVILRPSRRADAQDLFIAGMEATVEGVFHDVDGGVHVAVVVDGDPGVDLNRTHGRYRYFAPDELEVL